MIPSDNSLDHKIFSGQACRFCRRLLLLLACLTFPLAGLGAQTVKIGLYQNPPKIFLDESGRPSGFFIDLLEAIAAAEQWRLEYVNCEWRQCLEAVRAGDIDLMPDVAYTAERARVFDFNERAVLSNWSVLYARDPEEYQSILDLDGKSVAVIAGSIQAHGLKRLAREFSIKPNLIELNNSLQALRHAAEAKADAALVNRLFGQRYAADHGLAPTHILIEPSRLHFVAAHGRNKALLSAIDKHLLAYTEDKNSVYSRALQRWIPSDTGKGLPLWLLWTLEALGLTLLLLAVISFSLQRAVRKKTRELEQKHHALSESEEMFHALFDNASDAMLLSSGEQLIDCNDATVRLFGYADKESFMRLSRENIFPPTQPSGVSSQEEALRMIQRAMESGYANFEWLHRKADGTTFLTEVSLVPMHLHGRAVIHATIRDLTPRKQHEKQLQQLNRALKTLSAVNHTLVHSKDESGLLNEICRAIVNVGGYRLAWVGFAQYDDRRTVKPVAQYGFEEGYLEGLRISWQNDEYGRGPTGTAIRTGKAAVVRNIHNDPKYAPWREQACRRGYASSIALPLLSEHAVIGALNIYSDHPDAFDEEELLLLNELADDVAFGIHTQRMQFDQTHIEEERSGHKKRLQSALLQTIQAITAMVEMRDPFTAGHQRRVAELAVAIAEELHLDPVRIEGLRFGGMIHDIGNIYVPAEILNRPGELSKHELAVVRTHVQVGYDIVKDIDFPWPIAEMVLNHHERLDGSGYPAGHKGDDIPLDARILAVADVVEAMLSHRPYRPSLGIEATLADLTAQRGVKYDAEVVDACVRLFREKNYMLPV